MGETAQQGKTLFSEFVDAITDHRLGDFMRERKVPARLLSSKIREGNVHGSAWQTMLQHAVSANMLGEVAQALESYGEELTAGQLDQASRTGLKNLISQSGPEQIGHIAEILKKSGRELSYDDIIAPQPDHLDHHIVGTRFDSLTTLLEQFGHTLDPQDILREDASGRTILQTALMDKKQTGNLLDFLKETGTEIDTAELTKFYSTHQSHLGQTARTLMAIAADAGNAESLLKLPMPGGRTGASALTKKHFADIIGAMPTAESARDFMSSPLWRNHRDSHGKALSALLESRFKDDEDGWVQEFISRIQIQRSKELVTRRRRQHAPRA